MLTQSMATPKQLAEALGKGYTEFKAQSMVLTLARKGAVGSSNTTRHRNAYSIRGRPTCKQTKIA